MTMDIFVKLPLIIISTDQKIMAIKPVIKPDLLPESYKLVKYLLQDILFKFTCPHCVSVGFLQVCQFPPTSQNMPSLPALRCNCV